MMYYYYNMISICALRDMNIINNDGTLTDYKYTVDQSALIIRRLRDILQRHTIHEYLRTPGNLPYPDCIARQIIRKHQQALCNATSIN